jgi:hypothetical protein
VTRGGAAVSGTKVTAKHLATNEVFQTTADAQGAFINAFNHPSFSFGDVTFDNANFGRINSVRVSDRQINFILAINF